MRVQKPNKTTEEETCMKIEEGYMPYLEGNTYYRIAGEGNKPPLILLHGGPGSTHNYFETFDELAEDGRRIITYDQVGCGKSYLSGHPEYFSPEVWLCELEELVRQLKLDHFHVLGQSWGGMLALLYALDRKKGEVQSVILSSTLPSSKLWEEEQARRISYMEEEDRIALKKAQDSGNYEDPAYKKALKIFMKRYSDPLVDNLPECMMREKKAGKEAYETAWGPNEFTPTGTLKDFDVTDRLGEIELPVLITNGQRDLSSPYIAKYMYDKIPAASWELFQYSGHMPFIEEHERYMNVLKEWLRDHD